MSFTFGPEWARDTGCCAKPVGCTNTSPACLMLGHPWKRRHALTSPTSLFEVDPADVADTTDDWYTPPWLFKAAGITFDLDVAAPVDPARRTCPARAYLTPVEDGLTADWGGTVWMNPPYSQAARWVDRWADHPDGLALLPAMREVKWLGALMGSADAAALLSMNFGRPDGTVARIKWLLILAARGEACVSALARVAAADKYAHGAYHVRPGRQDLRVTSRSVITRPCFTATRRA